MDEHNVTADTFSQTYNTQRENVNERLTSEKLDKSDALAETLKYLTINDTAYYESDSANENDEKVDSTRNPKIVTHTSDENKRKFTDTSNRYLQQKLWSNWTLKIVTTTMDPRIDDSIATCSGTPHTLVTPTTKELVTDTAFRSARVLRTPMYVIRKGSYGTTPRDTPHSVRNSWDNSPVLIGGIGMP